MGHEDTWRCAVSEHTNELALQFIDVSIEREHRANFSQLELRRFIGVNDLHGSNVCPLDWAVNPRPSKGTFWPTATWDTRTMSREAFLALFQAVLNGVHPIVVLSKIVFCLSVVGFGL